MKVGIIGAGFVGAACAYSMLLRGSCHEIVLVDIDKRRARGRANDLSDAEGLSFPTRIMAGEFADLRAARIVVVTAGINEKTGRAIDRNDNLGRLRLLPHNAKVYAEIIPKIARFAPLAIIIVVTDPPDALADVARRYTTTNPIISTGTFLDTLRFRKQIARRIGCHPNSVDAIVIGEHGKSQVYVWSTARVGSKRVIDLARGLRGTPKQFQQEVEGAVLDANIDIIEGTGASQHGIGVVTARIVEAILRNENLVAPVGTWSDYMRVTLSLPAVIGRHGIAKVIQPPLTASEKALLAASARTIKKARKTLNKQLKPGESGDSSV